MNCSPDKINKCTNQGKFCNPKTGRCVIKKPKDSNITPTKNKIKKEEKEKKEKREEKEDMEEERDVELLEEAIEKLTDQEMNEIKIRILEDYIENHPILSKADTEQELRALKIRILEDYIEKHPILINVSKDDTRQELNEMMIRSLEDYIQSELIEKKKKVKKELKKETKKKVIPYEKIKNYLVEKNDENHYFALIHSKLV